MSGLPTHEHGSQMRKGRKRQAFSKEVTQLIMRVNLDQLDIQMLPKPIILDGIMLGVRSHMAGLKTSKGESAHIILIHFDIEIGNQIKGEANGSAKRVTMATIGNVFLQAVLGQHLGLHGR